MASPALNANANASSSATQLTLTSLPPEILGRIATFLDIFHHATTSSNDRGDVSSFLSVVGKLQHAAPHIQRAYMTNSVHYLHFCGSRDGITARWRSDDFDAAHTRDNLLLWMDINDGWRDAHRPYMARRPIPNLHADIVLRPIVTEDDADRLEAELLDASDHLTFESMPKALFRRGEAISTNNGRNNQTTTTLPEDFPYDVVIGIDGVDCTGMPYDEVKKLIMKRSDKEKKIRCLHSVFWCFFLSKCGVLGLKDWHVPRVQSNPLLDILYYFSSTNTQSHQTRRLPPIWAFSTCCRIASSRLALTSTLWAAVVSASITVGCTC